MPNDFHCRVVRASAFGRTVSRQLTTCAGVALLGAVASTVAHAQGATVRGTVFDSTEMRPFKSPTVELVVAGDPSKARLVTADSLGRFQIPDVAPGSYLIGFFHPRVDSLTLSASARKVEVSGAGPVTVNLALASPRTIVSAVCGTDAAKDSTGLFVGFIRNARDETPIAPAVIGVAWSEIVFDRAGIHRSMPARHGTASMSGFALCGVPAGASIVVRAASGADSSGLFELEVPRSGLLHRDIFVGPANRRSITATDSGARGDTAARIETEVLRGTARAQGRVVGSNGAPLRGALVSVAGSGLEALTDESGTFGLDSLPEGTHTLDVRAVGFLPDRRPIDLVEGRSARLTVELTPQGVYLDTVKVYGQRVFTSPQMAAFERRKKMGLGHFLDEREIERRNPMQFTDLLRVMPGVQVVPRGGSDNRVYMRGGSGMGGGYCTPDIVLDGMRVAGDVGGVDWLVTPQDVRAVEVYSRGSQVPAEFQSLSGCGVIVIWTGPRTPRPPGVEPKKR
jgi:hypothetical protein